MLLNLGVKGAESESHDGLNPCSDSAGAITIRQNELMVSEASEGFRRLNCVSFNELQLSSTLTSDLVTQDAADNRGHHHVLCVVVSDHKLPPWMVGSKIDHHVSRFNSKLH